jgi:opacity protein-like surface antigen
MKSLKLIAFAVAIAAMNGEALAQEYRTWNPGWRPNIGLSVAGRQLNTEFHGFGEVSAGTYGVCVDTDFWDTAIRYAGEFAGFRIAANVQACEGIGSAKKDIGAFEASTRREESFIATVRTGPMVPYGVYVFNPYVEVGAAYTRFKVEAIPFEHFSGYKPGVSFGAGVSVFVAPPARVVTGTVQPIDQQAIEIYLAYRHYDYGGATLNGGARVDLTVDEIQAGARVRF